MGGSDRATGVLLDLDGTVHSRGVPFPGAVEALARIKQSGAGVRFLSNTTTQPRSSIAAMLASMGIPIGSPDEILTPAEAAVELLRRRGAARCFLCVEEALKPVFGEFETSGDRPDYVVIGDIGRRWDYELVNRLFRLVMNGAGIIALHRNRYWRTEDGLSVDIGAFVAGLEYAAGARAEVAGKPSRAFFRLAVRSLRLDPSGILSVGDDVESDIAGAAALGIRGVLVRTGKYDPREVGRAKVIPWRTVDSIADVPGLLSDGPP